MIKFLLGGLVALALVGGAISFTATEHSWNLSVDKKLALTSVVDGVSKVYTVGSEIVADVKEAKEAKKDGTGL